MGSAPCGLVQRASLEGPKKKPRATAGLLLLREPRLFADDRFALDFDFDATIRCVAGDQFLPVLLVTYQARYRLGLAHAQGFDLVLGHALAHQVVADGVSTALGQLLVVGLRADRIGMAGD